MFVLWAVGMGFLFFTRETEEPEIWWVHDYTAFKSSCVEDYYTACTFAGQPVAKNR